MTMSDTQTAEANIGNFPAQIGEAIQGAICETLAMFLGEAPEFVSADRPEAPEDAVIGIMTYEGTGMFTMAMALPKSTAEQLAVLFAGFEIEFDSPDMADVVGEIVNVLSGDVVARMQASGGECAMGLPSVINGKEVQVMYPSGASLAAQSYTCAAGPFWVELCAELKA